MVQRFCPVCDQRMHTKHYCKICKSWVKHPYVRETGYYLNERHPADEADCSYHGGSRDVGAAGNPGSGSRVSAAGNLGGGSRVGTAGNLGGGSQGANGNPGGVSQGAAGNPGSGNYGTSGGWAASGSSGINGNWAASGSSGAAVRPAVQGSGDAGTVRPKRKASSKNTAIIAVVIVLVAIWLFTAFAIYLFDIAERLVTETFIPGYDVDLGDFHGEEPWDGDYKELDDDEVIAMGEPCNSVAHFEITGEDLDGPLIRLLESHGLEAAVSDPDSYNERYGDGATWYTTWTEYGLGNGEHGTEQYLELDCDTATGAVHGIELVLEDPDSLADLTGGILEMLEGYGVLRQEDGYAGLVREGMPSAMAQEGEYLVQAGQVYIEGMAYEDCYAVYIYGVLD